MVEEQMTNQCCFLSEQTIRYNKPGSQILYFRTEAEVKCKRGWTGYGCDACAPNFEPPGECSRCRTGLAGNDCDACARGWTGPNCDECDLKFGPPGECDTCLTGWTGPVCQYCEGFGFSTESNCTECIQNGRWEGRRSRTDMEVYLTFTGSSCSELIPGK